MPNFNSVQLAAYAATPGFKTKSAVNHGKLRVAEWTYRAPTSGTAPAIADKIVWGKLPVRAKILGHLSILQWSAGTALCTLNVGDNIVPARHLAATAVTAAGTAVPNAAALTKTCTCDTVNGSPYLTFLNARGAIQPGDLLSGTGIPTGAFALAVNNDQVTMSANATASTTPGTGTTITAVGASFETSNDSANEANGWTTTQDDCTLLSTVAGAQIANNQVIRLRMVYAIE